MATEPDQMASVVTTNDDVNVVISWSATPHERGSAVVAYRVTIHSKHAVGIEQADHCKGTDSTIFTARSCSVPISVLAADPYFLEEGDLIVAQIEALNAINYSPISEANTGDAVMKQKPH